MTDTPTHVARVLRSERVSPHVVRVTLNDVRTHDGSPAATSCGRADEFFGLWFPSADAPEPTKRYYTVRAWRPDLGELDIDLLLHGPGAASRWAEQVRDGDEVGFDAPRGHYAPPADATWIGLCGDATALPAIGRILDERAADPAAPPVHVVLALDDPADRPVLCCRADDVVDWVETGQLVTSTLALTDRTTAGYLWFAGEAADMRVVRRRVRHELGWPVERWSTMAYWRRDSETWLARVQADAALIAQLDAVYAYGDDAEEQQDRAEDLLAGKGLL